MDMKNTPNVRNASGVVGVSYIHSQKIWSADLQIQKKKYKLGKFAKKEDAIKARKEAEKKYHGEFLDAHPELKINE